LYTSLTFNEFKAKDAAAGGLTGGAGFGELLLPQAIAANSRHIPAYNLISLILIVFIIMPALVQKKRPPGFYTGTTSNPIKYYLPAFSNR
jgi:hypothetical protein